MNEILGINDPATTAYPQTTADPHAHAGDKWMAGRIAIVTGGGLSGPAGGVGYAISHLFARQGARVTVVDRDPAAGETTVSEIHKLGGEALLVVGDVTRESDCDRAVAETTRAFGGLDTLVNNVALGDRAGLFDATRERWDELIALNLTSAWLMTRSALGSLREGSAVVNVSSVATRRQGPGTVYGVAKAGIENMTSGAASLLGPKGIRVNCIQLGEIWSSMAARGLPPEARERRRRGVALQAEGTCWDAAYAALFLASDRARWVSGHVLTVEGGGPYRAPFGSSGGQSAPAAGEAARP
ncbi:MAG: SDR family NAD(P)-dependent oxidoreductase [Micromonosporaceae bacterium]